MSTKLDQLGKHLLARMSAPLGTTEQQREILTEPQAADLPEEHDTLLLRVLGRGRTFHRSMHGWHELPADAWEVALAIPLLLAFRLDLSKNAREEVYEARFGALPPAVQAVIEDPEDTGILQQWVAPFATRTPEEIAALVRGR